MYCRNCGTQSQAGDVFCRGCGARLPQEPRPDHRYDSVSAQNTGHTVDFGQAGYTEDPKPADPRSSAPKPKKRSPLAGIVVTAAVIGLLAGVGAAAWYLDVPDKIIAVVSGQAAGPGSEGSDLASVMKIEDLDVSRKDGFYTATATVTMPDLSQCLANLSEGLDDDGGSYEETGELLSEELVKYAKGRKAPKVTLDVRVSLKDEARRKVSSLEFLMENPVTDAEDYEFTDSEIQELICQEAIRMSFRDYMDSVYDGLDLDDNGIIPEALLTAGDELLDSEEEDLPEPETTAASD